MILQITILTILNWLSANNDCIPTSFIFHQLNAFAIVGNNSPKISKVMCCRRVQQAASKISSCQFTRHVAGYKCIPVVAFFSIINKHSEAEAKITEIGSNRMTGRICHAKVPVVVGCTALRIDQLDRCVNTNSIRRSKPGNNRLCTTLLQRQYCDCHCVFCLASIC